jgi:hypothetical protein
MKLKICLAALALVSQAVNIRLIEERSAWEKYK